MSVSRSEGSGVASAGPQLIAYADRLGGSIAALDGLMSGVFAGAFRGVHLLPFYRPFDGADAGFDPRDHTEVDERLGSWDHLRALAGGRAVIADVIVNHMSTESAPFRDVVAHGDASPWATMFLTLRSIFPDGATEHDLATIYRPRPGLPFTVMNLAGQRRLVWTTFSDRQVDLDIREPATWTYLRTVIDRLTAAGVTMLRLDAVGYVGKVAGTNCFMTAESVAFVNRISDYADERGVKILVEVHGHYLQQLETARIVDYVYDFALPPLVLHALITGDAVPLDTWLAIRPVNTVTVLDTHDGIGVVDVGPNELRPGHPGLLTAQQIDDLVESIHVRSGGTSRLASGAAASNLDRYQINCTFYDALGADDSAYLLARLIQLFVPGIPQVYYVGLLAGRNDVALLAETGVGRDVNRHRYSLAEVETELQRYVVRAQLNAVRFRAQHPAFRGTFTHHLDGQRLQLRWRTDEHEACLDADVSTGTYTITLAGNGHSETVSDPLDLPTAADQ